MFIDWRHLGELLAAGSAVYSELKNHRRVGEDECGARQLLSIATRACLRLQESGDAPHFNNIELGRHGRNRSNVWNYAGVNTFRAGRMDELAMHPTVKPVALVADAMKDCSRRGDIVLDPFMGSGTTIVAAERVGRRAYGLEIDPPYVDVAVRRWQAYARRDAILQGTRPDLRGDRRGSQQDGGRAMKKSIQLGVATPAFLRGTPLERNQSRATASVTASLQQSINSNRASLAIERAAQRAQKTLPPCCAKFSIARSRCGSEAHSARSAYARLY